MNANVHDLGQLQPDQVVVVSLRGNAANVRLLDSTGLSNFKRGKVPRIYGGGLVKKSPYRMVIPRSGRWYVTVDLMGMKPNARVQSAVSVEPPPLAVARNAEPSPLATVRTERPQLPSGDSVETWDVFISHASEDKADVARPLRDALHGHGVKVWFDAFELVIGDSLRRKIDQGLARSTFGVVVLSAPFFAKGWTQYELDGIVTRSVADGESLLLPIWHKVSKAEVAAKSPSLADKVALNTSEYTVEEIAEQIARRVRPDLFVDDIGDAPRDLN